MGGDMDWEERDGIDSVDVDVDAGVAVAVDCAN